MFSMVWKYSRSKTSILWKKSSFPVNLPFFNNLFKQVSFGIRITVKIKVEYFMRHLKYSPNGLGIVYGSNKVATAGEERGITVLKMLSVD